MEKDAHMAYCLFFAQAYYIFFVEKDRKKCYLCLIYF